MKTLFILVLGATACLMTGCQSRVVFATHSSVGLDVSGTAQLPNKVSFSFERYEAAIIPRKTNGAAHSVYGGMDTDMTWFHGHAIKQTFATGEAARLATGASPEARVGTTVKDKAPLIFFTSTAYGLNLSAGEQSMPPNLLLGYRREEAAVIPVPDPAQEVRSVYADINIATGTNATDITTNFSALGGVRIKESFATGAAADALAANNPEVKQKLMNAAGIAATKQTLHDLSAKAKDLAEKIDAEIDRLNDNRLTNAVAALKAAKVFSASDLANPEQIPPRDLSRRIKHALQILTQDEYSDPGTVNKLKDALSKLQQIQN